MYFYFYYLPRQIKIFFNFFSLDVESLAEDPISATMIPKTYSNNGGYYHDGNYRTLDTSMYLHCKTAFDKMSVVLSFKKNPNNPSSSRDENPIDGKSQYAEKTILIYFYQNPDSARSMNFKENPNSYLNYTCVANFDSLDVYPYAYSSEIATFTWPITQKSKIKINFVCLKNSNLLFLIQARMSLSLEKQNVNAYTLSWTIDNTDSSVCIEYRPKFYVTNKGNLSHCKDSAS
jgi:hypothetical protein